MENEKDQPDFQERRTEPRRIIDRFFSVEFQIPDSAFIFQYKIWDISDSGLCLLAKTDSEILHHIRPGDQIRMKYYPTDQNQPPEFLDTRVAHITPAEQGRYKGHVLIGLSVQRGQAPPPEREGGL